MTQNSREISRKSNNPEPSNKTELEMYLEEPRVNVPDLEYWKTNESRFPVLAQMARNYLAIQGTNRDIEGTFSKVISSLL